MLISVLPQQSPRALKSPAIHFGANSSLHSSPTLKTVKIVDNPSQGLAFAQGFVSNCEALAFLYGLSRHPLGVQQLNNMVKILQSGDYQVTFPSHPDKPVLVRQEELKHEFFAEAERQDRLPFPAYPFVRTSRDVKPDYAWESMQEEFAHNRIRRGDIPEHARGNQWVQLLELAFVKLQKQLKPHFFAGIPENRLTRVYDNPQFLESQSRQEFFVYPGWEIDTIGHLDKKLLRKAQPTEEIIVLGTREAKVNPKYRNCYLDDGNMILVQHAYYLEKNDTKSETLTVRHAHNTRLALVIPYEDALGMFDRIIYLQPPRETSQLMRLLGFLF